VQNFFTNVKSKITEAGHSTKGIQSLNLTDDANSGGLTEQLEQAQKDVEAALLNSFDTPTVMLVISKLVRDANVFLREHPEASLRSAEAVARWVTKMVGVFGLDANAKPPYDGLGWAASGTGSDLDVTKLVTIYTTVKEEVQALSLSETSIQQLLNQSPQTESSELEKAGEKDPEQLALPFIRAISQLRDELRRIVSSVTPENKKAILALSDRIRDYDLTNLGVQLDDQPDKPSLIKFVPAAKLIAAREEKVALAAQKARQKEEARLARERAEQEKWEKAKVAPETMFKGDEKYAEWDAEGLPTKMADGNELTKAATKKLKKEWDRQKRLHEEYLAKFGTTS
jgi:cysteinyl-tRNA synthetase